MNWDYFVCRHVSMWGFRNPVCLSVPRGKKSPYLYQYQSYISNWYINGKVFTSTTAWKPPKKWILFSKQSRNWIFWSLFSCECVYFLFCCSLDWIWRHHCNQVPKSQFQFIAEYIFFQTSLKEKSWMTLNISHSLLLVLLNKFWMVLVIPCDKLIPFLILLSFRHLCLFCYTGTCLSHQPQNLLSSAQFVMIVFVW